MNQRQFQLLMEMFSAQTEHVITTLEQTVTEDGVEAAHNVLEEAVKANMRILDASNDRNGSYEFQMALCLPSLFLAGLYLDLQLEHVEIVRSDSNSFSVGGEVFKR